MGLSKLASGILFGSTLLFQNCDVVKPFESQVEKIQLAINPTAPSISRDVASSNYLGDTRLWTPSGASPKFWLVPNQLAANAWYQPDGHLINGHLAESFAHFEYWPTLSNRLVSSGHGFGIMAAEIGFMTDAELLSFRTKGLPVSVETPGFTQCFDGYAIGNAEFLGSAVPGTTFFSSIYHTQGVGRWDPANGGWFVSKDGHRYAPDEIIFDERLPGLLPLYDAFGNVVGDDPCPQAASFNPGADRLTGLINDYVEYARTVKTSFSPAPKISMHWAVNPTNWEYRDPQCIAQLAKYTNPNARTDAYNTLSSPCYKLVSVLQRVVDGMCKDSNCPAVVYIDADYIKNGAIQNTTYTVEAMTRISRMLATYGIPMGIDIVNQETNGQYAVNQSNGNLIPALRGGNVNANDQESQLNVVSFFKSNGLLTVSTPLRVESWQNNPSETGAQISENTAGSFASTTLRILNEYIEPGFISTSSSKNPKIYLDRANRTTSYRRGGATDTLHRLTWTSAAGWNDWDMGYGMNGGIVQDRQNGTVFYFRGVTNTLHRLTWTSAAGWNDWDMGYGLNGDIVQDQQNGAVFYFRGATNTLHRLTWTSAGGWNDWDMGYGLNGDIVQDQQNGAVFYFRGATDTLHRLTWTSAAGWNDWDMGYGMTGDIVQDQQNGTVFYFRGATNTLHRLTWTSAAGWNDWDMGYGMTGDIVQDQQNGTVFYFRGATNTLHRLTWTSAAGWNDWDMGYGMTGAIVQDQLNGAVFYFRGATNTLHRLTWTSAAGWNDWDMGYSF